MANLSAAGSPNFEYKVDLRRLDAASSVEKEYPEKLRRNEPVAPKAFTGSITFVDLAPGETRRDDILLNTRYQIDQVGKYVVQVERELPPDLGGGVLKSNQLQLEISRQ